MSALNDIKQKLSHMKDRMKPTTSPTLIRCPCKGCGKRSPECHGKCEEYLDWSKKEKALRTERERQERIKYGGKRRKYIKVHDPL